MIELGLATRDVPFGEPPRTSRRSLYRIADPFTRLWFRTVAPHRAELVSGTRQSRLAVLNRYWDGLVAATWEQLCRDGVPSLTHRSLGAAGEWKPASRWWAGNAPEWDIVAEDVQGTRVLIGEATLTTRDLRALADAVARRPPPELPSRYRSHTVVRALFVPEARRIANTGDVAIVTLHDLTGGRLRTSSR